jgi:hypothetical protein
VGTGLGLAVGTEEGFGTGMEVGVGVGRNVGALVGCGDGKGVGGGVGSAVGTSLHANESSKNPSDAIIPDPSLPPPPSTVTHTVPSSLMSYSV